MARQGTGAQRRSSIKKTVKDQSGAGKVKIGELLSKAGYITPSQLETAKKILQKKGGRLSTILRQLEYIDDNTVLNFLSRQHNYPAVVIRDEPPSKDVLNLLRYEQAKEFMAFPLRMAGNTLQVTMTEPSDATAVEELQNLVNKELSVCVSTENDIVEAYQKYYGIDETEANSFLGAKEDAEEELDITQVD
ncbi:MAG: type IV-A pilus assembly ATPase PilB, partial [Desulforhopalus sp.]|nr:type IV-A pilus assembly ATPase PilB [Desulforhopalus sp.]